MTSKERKKREEVREEGQDLTDSKSKNLGEKLKALQCTINKKMCNYSTMIYCRCGIYLPFTAPFNKLQLKENAASCFLQTNIMAWTAHPFFHLVVHTQAHS